jgi:hypothetical protein
MNEAMLYQQVLFCFFNFLQKKSSVKFVLYPPYSSIDTCSFSHHTRGIRVSMRLILGYFLACHSFSHDDDRKKG